VYKTLDTDMLKKMTWTAVAPKLNKFSIQPQMTFGGGSMVKYVISHLSNISSIFHYKCAY